MEMIDKESDNVYRIVFLNKGQVYELFCRSVGSSGIPGFVEVAELEFETDESLVIDPTEERMREEFEGVEKLHLPIHSVLRIEQVRRRGACVIRDTKSGEKVTPLPLDNPRRNR